MITRSSFGALALAGGIALLASSLMPVPAAARTTTWYHNGSEMGWSSYAGLRQVIKYRYPRPIVARKGATHGAVLFRGWRVGRRLYGKARTWRRGCLRSFKYRVRGWISRDGTRAVLHGRRPVIRNCRIVDYVPYGRDATLILTRGHGHHGRR